MFERGKIILVPFPFTDLSSQKVRPAVIVSVANPYAKDVIVAFVSSVVTKASVVQVKIAETMPAFDHTGLKKTSVVRCDKLATLDRKIVLGELGAMPLPLLRKIDAGLRRVLGL